MLNKIINYSIYAQSTPSGCPRSGQQNVRLRQFLECGTFDIPLFALKVLAVGFFLFALFRGVAAIAESKYTKVFGWIISGALAIFLGFNPAIIADLVEVIGNLFTNITQLFA